MRLFSLVFGWIFGWEEPTANSRPEIEPTYMADTGDTGTDTGNSTEDTSQSTETGDSGETGETGDSGDSADSATETDTALKSAMDLAGENGGFGCATVSSSAALSVWLGILALGWRRRE